MIPSVELEKPVIKSQVEIVSGFLLEISNGAHLSSVREQNGFFISCVRELWYRLRRIGCAGNLDFVQKALSALLDEYRDRLKIRDALVMSKILKRGVSEKFLVHDEGKPRELKQFSRIVKDLEINANYFPPFYIYIGREERFSDSELQEMRRAFGRHLAESLICEKATQ